MPAVTLVILVLFMQAPAATPPGWEATMMRGQQHVLDRKFADAIALFERVVKQAPAFDGGHYELAEAHRMQGLELALKGPSQQAAQRRHLETAATHYRRVADLRGEYHELGVMKLMMIYGEDELNRPADLVPAARMYVQVDPASASGHVTLAQALLATGQTVAATTTLLQARKVVKGDEERLLAVRSVDYVLKATGVPPADVRALLDYAQPVLDRLLKREPDDRVLVLAKMAVLQYRADVLETDPARKKALKAESDKLFERVRNAK